MNQISLAVKVHDPKMGPLEIRMRFVGQTEVAEFLRDNPAETDRLQAWLAEIRYRHWGSAESLSEDFGSVDTSRPPLTIFQLKGSHLRIATLIDFRTSVVLLLSIRRARSHPIWENVYHDH